MREIKFRLFSQDTKKVIYPDDKGWFNKAFVGKNGVLQDIRIDVALKRTDKVTVMQYTGVKDINGTEIFEGDILRIASNFELRKDVQNQAVEYREGYFHTFEWTLFELLRNKKVEKQTFEVIGNIYLNQELLETVE